MKDRLLGCNLLVIIDCRAKILEGIRSILSGRQKYVENSMILANMRTSKRVRVCFIAFSSRICSMILNSAALFSLVSAKFMNKKRSRYIVLGYINGSVEALVAPGGVGLRLSMNVITSDG